MHSMAKIFLVCCALWMAATASLGAQTLQSDNTAIGNLQVSELHVVDIDTDHLRISVSLLCKAAQNSTLDNLRISGMRLNGMPLFAAPLNQHIELHKGESVALPTLYLSVYFRDLYTVAPLREMIENQKVHLVGELDADLHLNFMQKLAMHTQHPSIAIPIAQDVPVEVSGLPFARTLALGTLTLLERGLQAKASAAKFIPGEHPAWIREAEKQAKFNLFLVFSRYALEKDHSKYPVESLTLGFRADPLGIVAPSESHQPWNYDPEFLAAVKSGNAKLVKKSEEVELLVFDAGNSASRLTQNDFSINLHGNPEDFATAQITAGHDRVKLFRRDAPGLFVRLVQHTTALTPGFALAPPAILAQEQWEKVAVFRLRFNKDNPQQRTLDVIEISAQRDGQSIHLSEPVDSAVFGSPILTPDGVIGMVQSEQNGTFLQ